MIKAKTPVAVLISGNGSNLQALIDAASAADFPARIVGVLSNKVEAYGLERAKKAGIPTQHLSHKDYETREAFDRAMHEKIKESGAQLICLAGFMRLLSPWFVSQWQGRMLNIHPSLLPEFKGLDAIGQALAAGAETTGCTVHYVTEAMDEGPVIMQQSVDILPDDTHETLAARIHKAEHEIYPQALKQAVLALTN